MSQVCKFTAAASPHEILNGQSTVYQQHNEPHQICNPPLNPFPRINSILSTHSPSTHAPRPLLARSLVRLPACLTHSSSCQTNQPTSQLSSHTWKKPSSQT